MTDTAWMADALCAETDIESFHPDKGGSSREAKTICQNCDVREKCLNYALEHREMDGIWGGKSPNQRVAILKGMVA